MLLNLTLPLRIHKRTEIRSDLEKEKSKTGRRGCRDNKKQKRKVYEIIDRIESGYRRSDRLRRIDNRSHGPGA